MKQTRKVFSTLLNYCFGSVALLKAYFDESERANGLLCVAGYVFGPQQAQTLTSEFRRAFGCYGGFHMKDLVHKKKGFKAISDDERTRLIKVAVDSVKYRFRYGVAVTVNKAEYKALAPDMKGFRSPYSFLCHLAMSATAQMLRRHGDLGPLMYVFEAGHANEAEARYMVGKVGLIPELKAAYMHYGDVFLPKADAVPLQAADLLAWESSKFKDETVDQKIREIRKSLSQLLKVDMTRYSLAFCSGEPLVKALRRYAQEFSLESAEEERAWALQEKKRNRSS